MADQWWGGIPVYVSDQLPMPPSHREDARRIVRHGMAEILEWLGEDVGPEPGAPTHILLASDGGRDGVAVVAFASRELIEGPPS